ncbi:unnamed protein product [Bursaphelenchus okinawaensis]|uniref:C2 domain-containing protein n=1 Tax=Bursaphelenchus okinawaensis TaxID=465554 RepID=A0A811LAF3_9BILA|nr:unnamed protein product [Bursaphelenchus okinawaensis]CAG9120080.1 unnamed protein product [Bursaphelenchus okinawaensis]
MKQLLLFILVCGINSAPVHIGSAPFWTSVRIQDITWRPECITDRNCQDMTFSVSFQSADGEGRKQASWPLNQVTRDTSNAELTVYWKSSVQENITIDSSLTATDVLFNIPRPCDQSSPLRTFVPSIKALASNGPSAEYLVNPEETRIVGLVGKCYHAVAEIKLYRRECPWCVEIKKDKEDEGSVLVTSKLQLAELFESPFVVGAIIVCFLVFFIGIILGSYCLHKAYQIHKYNEHYSTPSLPDTVFTRNVNNVCNIPMPPMLLPPLLPSHNLHMEGPYMYPQYETLDTVVEKKEANYDSALESSDNDSPNGSFSEKREQKGEYV